jgi:hypothetical protein
MLIFIMNQNSKVGEIKKFKWMREKVTFLPCMQSLQFETLLQSLSKEIKLMCVIPYMCILKFLPKVQSKIDFKWYF